MNKWKKLLSLILAISMMLSVMSLSITAAETTGPEIIFSDNNTSEESTEENESLLVDDSSYGAGESATTVTQTVSDENEELTETSPREFIYTKSSTSVAITGYQGTGGAVVIPSKIDDLPVTTIVSSAFKNNSNITSIVIPDSVTSIGYEAFYYCSRLTNVTIGNGVTSIGSEAFYYCPSLENVTIGNGVTSISSYAFSSCSNLENVYITDLAAWCNISFSAYNSNPLDNAENLYLNGELVTDLVIPEGVSTIKSYAFYDCDSITSVTIPDSVTSIGSDAFDYCSNLTKVYITDLAAWCNFSFSNYYSNPLCYAENLYLNGELVTDLVIPEGVSTIKSYAFFGCKSITTVTLPDTVNTINSYTFSNCSNISNIELPASVTSIKNYAFNYCSKLKEITVTPTLTEIAINAFNNCTIENIYFKGTRDQWNNMLFINDAQFANATVMCVCEDSHTYTNNRDTTCNLCEFVVSARADYDYTIENKKATIDLYAGEGGEVTVPSHIEGYPVTTIGESAFLNCESITSITLPTTVKTIGSSAFKGCSNLTSVSLPNTISVIADETFYGCIGLTSIYFPTSITDIGNKAFYGCTGLTSLRITNTITAIADDAFGNCELEKVDFAGTHSEWNSKSYANISSFADTTIVCTCQGGHTFTDGNDDSCNECDYVLTLFMYDVIGNTVAISRYNGIGGNVNVPEKINGMPVTAIVYRAFRYDSDITSITLPDTIKSIGYEAFYGCSKLESISMPDTVNSIGYSAFENCTSLKSFTIPFGVTWINNELFYNCTSLESVTIPYTVTSHSYGEFDYCPIKTVYFLGTQEEWNNSSLSNISQLNSANVIISLKKYNNFDYFISGNKAIIKKYNGIERTVNIPAEIDGYPVTLIGNGAFKDNTSITSVIIPDSVTAIGAYAFSGCSSITDITIGSGVKSIGYRAFYNCTRLKNVYINDLTSWCKISFDIDSYGSLSDTLPLGYASNLYLNGELLTELVIPDSITVINDYAFWDCESIKSVVIHDSVTSIGKASFSGCSNLRNVTIGENVQTIDSSAFDDCTNLNNVVIPNSVTSIGSYAFASTGLTSIVIPDSVTSLGDYSFRFCSNLKEVTIGSGITVLNQNQFYYVTSIKTLTITNSTTNIAVDIFSSSSIETINFIGTREEWNAKPYSTDAQFSGATVYCFCAGEHSYANADDTTCEHCDYVVPERAEYNYTVANGEITLTKYKGNGQNISIPSIIEGKPVTAINTNTFDGYTLETVNFKGSRTEWNSRNFSNLGIFANVNVICTCQNGHTYTDGADLSCNDCDHVLKYSDIFSYTIENNKVTITEYKGEYPNVVIPSEIDGKKVTIIGSNAFQKCTHVTSVSIPSSITSIYSNAFGGCSNLNDVYITDLAAWCNINFTGDLYSNPLYAANNLYINGEIVTELVIPDGVTTIKDDAFIGFSGITSVVLPDSVTSIGHRAFGECSSLTTVTFTGFVTQIQYNSFYSCSALKTVNFIGSQEEWNSKSYSKDSNFSGVTIVCTEKSSIICGDFVYRTYRGNAIVSKYTGSDTDVVIPSTVDEYTVVGIDKEIFKDNRRLKSVTLPSTLTFIGESAFYGCTLLKAINVPNSVKTIANNAFNGCTGLNDLTLGNNLVTIGENAFYNCTRLKNFKLPNSVKTIGYCAFYGCSSITDLVIPDSVITINDSAFRNCTSLTNVIIGDGVSVIGYYSFENCNQLETITMGTGITSIGEGAFRYCYNLENVYITDLAAWCNIDFAYYNGAYEYYSRGNNPLENAENLFVNNTLVNRLVIPDSVTSISPLAFYNFSGLTSVIIPDSVTSIGDRAFAECYNLTSVSIGSGIESINQYAFSQSTQINKLTLTNNTNDINLQAFAMCNIETINFIGSRAQWIDKVYAADAQFANATVYCTCAGDHNYGDDIACDDCDYVNYDKFSISGTLSSFGDQSEDIIITLYKDDEIYLVINTTDSTYSFENLIAGEYTMTVSKTNHATRTFVIIISDSDITQNVTISYTGDLSGDGTINVSDVGLLNAHVKNTNILEDYQLANADVNGDGKVNVSDVGLLNAHAKNQKPLW